MCGGGPPVLGVRVWFGVIFSTTWTSGVTCVVVLPPGCDGAPRARVPARHPLQSARTGLGLGLN